MDDSYERAGALGFRCVHDAVQKAEPPCDYRRGCVGFQIPDSQVDLSKLGDLDWIQYGMSGPQSINSKFGGKILERRLPSNATLSSYSNNPVSFSWQNGVPTNSTSGTTTGVYIDNGSFKIKVPASKHFRVIYIFVGVYRAHGELELTVGDQVTYQNDWFSNNQGTTNAVYAIAVSRSADISWKMKSADEEGGNVTFQAIAVSDEALNSFHFPGLNLESSLWNSHE